MTRIPSTRRTVLGTIAGTLTALAGCTDSIQSGDSGSPFQDVAVKESAVVVTLTSDNEVERVNLIDPDGNRVGSSKVVSGETRLEFELGMSYTPGTFDVVAEPSGETTIEIRPELSIQDVGVGANHMDRMPDSLGNTQSQEAFVVVENLGNGPTNILALIFGGEVPNPTEDVKRDGSKSGIFDAQEGKGELEKVPLTGGERITLYSSTLPFSLAAEGKDCESMPSTGTVKVRVFSSVSEQPHTARFDIRYSPTESDDGCEMVIEGRSE